MYKICRVNIERSGEIFENLERYKEEVIKRLSPLKIILFGSFARGDFSEGSDIDLIVISDWRESFLDRIKILMQMNIFHIPIEPIGYTKAEFENLISDENPFISQVLEEGTVIYQKGEV